MEGKNKKINLEKRMSRFIYGRNYDLSEGDLKKDNFKEIRIYINPKKEDYRTIGSLEGFFEFSGDFFKDRRVDILLGRNGMDVFERDYNGKFIPF